MVDKGEDSTNQGPRFGEGMMSLPALRLKRPGIHYSAALPPLEGPRIRGSLLSCARASAFRQTRSVCNPSPKRGKGKRLKMKEVF